MWESYFVGAMKLLAIGFSAAAGWPGGIFFPLFMAAASLGSATALWLNVHPTVGITCFMAALEAAVLRTPWSAVLIVLMTQGDFSSQTALQNSFLQTFPLMSVSVLVAMATVYWTRMYGDEQHGRRDLKPVEFVGDAGHDAATDLDTLRTTQALDARYFGSPIAGSTSSSGGGSGGLDVDDENHSLLFDEYETENL